MLYPAPASLCCTLRKSLKALGLHSEYKQKMTDTSLFFLLYRQLANRNLGLQTGRL